MTKLTETPKEDKTSQEIVSPSGQPIERDGEKKTERSEERLREDQSYVPVIVKRTDESRVHPDDILERAITEGLQQLNRPVFSLFLSAIAAGLILGFSAMAVAVVSAAVETSSPLIERLATAVVYPLGFIICILSGTQLFTEHTATAVYPVLDRKHDIKGLLRLWIVVIAGNLCGTLASAWLISTADVVVQAREGYLEIAAHLVSFGFSSLLISATLAGWLMAQGAWLVLASSQQSGQILCIYIVTFVIGVGGLHHSIAGSAEIFTAALMGDKYGAMDCIYFIGSALLGNLIGGSLFVATLNYAHIRSTQDKSPKKTALDTGKT